MEGRVRPSAVRQLVWMLVAAVASGGALVGLAAPAGAHSGDAIDSLWSSSAPRIDGSVSPGEWAAAASVNLTAIPGNRLPASLLVMNNATFLWVAYDAIGDTTTGANDSASFALDTGHDAVETDGGEDQFVVSGIFPGATAHVVYRGGYIIEDAPFDPGLPNHAGLAGARGFGPSDLSPVSHRMYEFQIPLVLVRAGPGDTLGLFGGSQPVPGVLDYDSGYAYSTWPSYVGGPIPLASYGDLNLATLPGPVGVTLSPATASANAAPGDVVWYNLTATNTGTSVSDTFDLTVASLWTTTLWASGGTSPLVDTDGDAVPDTGNLTSGSRTGIVVKVSLPPSATGCDPATVTARSSWNLSISDAATLRTCVGAAVFSPPHSDVAIDLDGNSRFDILRVNVSLAVSQSDFYQVAGDLYSGDGSVEIATAGVGFSASPGPYVVALDFNGRSIYIAGIDGPYLVRLSIFDSRSQQLDTDTYTTRAYRATDFEPPVAAFRPPHTDRGVDTDVPPNGFFDELWLNVNLTVGRAGTYYIDTGVFDSRGGFITYTTDSFDLPVGAPTVTIVYRGDVFYNAANDGPYQIQMALSDSFRTPIDFGFYVTGPYRRTDFDPPPIVFAPPHTDRGVDTDVPPDGYFDWLVVSARVSVTQADNYTVRGDLFGPGGFVYIATATVTSYLGLGPATVDLRFPGPLIRRAQASGNFVVYMVAGPAQGNGSFAFDSYTTGSYSYTQFQPPPALLSPPHTDRGVDVSAPQDGLYDWLEVGVGVNVGRAGRITLQGMLWGPRGLITVDTVTANLPVGRFPVPLRFDGHLIRLSGSDGPYSVTLSLRDATGTEIDTGTYLTAAYPASTFQPPDASAPASSAAVAGGYWKNGPVRVAFSASDPSPSDGLSSVELFYRYSANNATWLPWTSYESRSVSSEGLATFSGSFLFDLPVGEGYYEFYTVATDRAGGTEPAPAFADASVAAFVPARIDLTPLTVSLVAGTVRTFHARVVNAGGAAVALESPLAVTLLTDSRGGEFRAVGTSTAIASIVIPAGGSEGAFDYYDTVAGTTTITVASSRAAPDASIVSVGPGPVASITVSPASGGLAVGSSATFTATARDAYGNVVPNPTITWSVEGPGSLSTTSGTSVDMTATGDGFVRVTATSGPASATSTIKGIASGGGDGAASSNLAIGVGGGIALGLVAGIVVGWFLTRRRKGREPPAPPPPAEPPPGEN